MLARVRWSTFRVAVLAALLLATMEAILAVAAAASGQFHGIAPFLVDWLAKLPWGVVVCAGLWLGLEAGRNSLGWAALAGLLAPPVASLVARLAAEGLQGFPFAGVELVGLSPFLVAGLRGLEFAGLGAGLAWLAQRGVAGPLEHAGLGLLVGLVFGVLLLGLTAGLTSESLAGTALVKWAVNELLFPAGGALLIFWVRQELPRP